MKPAFLLAFLAILPLYGGSNPLDKVHPSFDLVNIRPDWFQPQISSMDFLPDGRLAATTIQIDDALARVRPGKILLISGLETNDPNRIEAKEFATDLEDPLGITVVDGRIYVMERNQLSYFPDKDKDDVADSRIAVATGWNYQNFHHEFAFWAVYKDGHFYVALSVSIKQGGLAAEQENEFRGCILKIPEDLNGQVNQSHIFAGGLRNTNQLMLGPDNDIWLGDNQGTWWPCSPVIQVKEGRFYGHADTPFQEREVSPPAAWLPHYEASASIAQLYYLREGIYQGQLLVSDNTYGGLQRLFVEKINGEFQGCAFRFCGGLEVGPQSVKKSPDGTLYVGGLGPGGTGGNWGWQGKKFGLQKLVPNNSIPFEMLAVRSRHNGMEIEFTHQVGEGADNEGSYTVSQFRYEPTAAYGGGKIDHHGLPVKSVQVSSDRKKVFLELSGLLEHYVVHIQVENLRSQSGEPIWNTHVSEAWYTLNAVSDSDPFAVNGCADPRYMEYNEEATVDDGSCQTMGKTGCMDPAYAEYDPFATVHSSTMCVNLSAANPGLGIKDEFSVRLDASGIVIVESYGKGKYAVSIHDIRGLTIARRTSETSPMIRFRQTRFRPGVYFVTIEKGTNQAHKMIVMP